MTVRQVLSILHPAMGSLTVIPEVLHWRMWLKSRIASRGTEAFNCKEKVIKFVRSR